MAGASIGTVTSQMTRRLICAEVARGAFGILLLRPPSRHR